MSESPAPRFDVIVVGAGPAGIAAAIAAAENGASVAVLDDNPRPGGQIWRGGPGAARSGQATGWFERLAKSPTVKFFGASVFAAGEGLVEAETPDGLLGIGYGSLILATGARERFLPFPGWTLPNVMGAGGLQALVKGGLPVAGRRVVVAGTGPLLLAVAAYLKAHGARVLCICEQASRGKLIRFGARLLRFPGKLRDAIRLRAATRGIPYLTDCWPVAALGWHRLEAVRISQNSKLKEVECDYLACGFHLAPNTELAQLIGCELSGGFVHVDEFQQTTVAGVYCAGEPTGIGGLDLSLLEGRIAGHAAAGNAREAQKLAAKRAREAKIAPAMAEAFRLRPELRELTTPETLICRCEDVPLQRMKEFDSWRAAKLQTRCGMGPCQGRVCGPAAEFLMGWQVDSVRPPVFPVKCEDLAGSEMTGAGAAK